jgi:sugar phosphate isomerase/epimerase
MQRRTALKTLASLPLLTKFPGQAGTRPPDSYRGYRGALGVQLFTIPKLVDQDLGGTLALLFEIGYREVEFFGPYPFSSAETKEDFKMLQAMIGLERHAFYGHPIEEVVAMLDDNGLSAPSLHSNITTLRKGLDAFLDGAAPLSPKYAVIPTLMEGRDTLDDYRRLADEFNEIGRRMQPYGMKLLYHNHGFEHAEREGVVPMDLLLEETDPAHVQFELDIFWMAAAGADPIDYLRRYPGRYKALHLKDAAETFRFSGDGSTPDQWFAGFPKMANPGSGVFDIPAILEAADANGVEHYFLERDLAPEPLETLRESYTYLKAQE